MRTAETVKNKPVILQTTLQAVSCQRFTGKPPFLGLNRHETLFSAKETHEGTQSHQARTRPGDTREGSSRGRAAAGRLRGRIPGVAPAHARGVGRRRKSSRSPPAAPLRLQPRAAAEERPVSAAALPHRCRLPQPGLPASLALPRPGTVTGGWHVLPAIYSSRLVFEYAGNRREGGKRSKTEVRS